MPMRYSYLALGLLCLSEQVSVAASSLMGGREFLPHEAYLSTKFKRTVDGLLDDAHIVRRIAKPVPQVSANNQPSASPAAGSGTNVDETGLMPSTNQTESACIGKLRGLNGLPSNPSGMSACYNVAAFNNGTGDFQANVLIYSIGLAEDEWQDLADGAMVTLQFHGATVREASAVKKRSLHEKNEIWRRQANEPQLMDNYTFVGVVDQAHSGDLTNVTIMREALSPVITLVARTTDGQDISQQLPNREAAFVNGFFTDAQVAAAQAAILQPGPFKLPGVTLGFFPIGLVVTSVWAIIFIGVVGAGTFGRWQFRQAYRMKIGGGLTGSQGMRNRFAAKAGYEKS